MIVKIGARYPTVALALAGIGLLVVSCGTVKRTAGKAVGGVMTLAGTAGNTIKRGSDRRHKEREDEQIKKTTGGETQVLGGTVRLVRPSMGFVLIQSSGSRMPYKGAELSVHRAGYDQQVATLKVSPERKTGFVVADILSGEPREGDVVMWTLPTMPEVRPEALMPPTFEVPEEELIAPDPINPQLLPVPPIDSSPSLSPGQGGDAEADLERELRRLGPDVSPDA